MTKKKEIAIGKKFYGYAAFYGVPCTDGDIFLPGCFSKWLKQADIGSVPMTNGHGGNKIGTWLHIGDDDLGLRVVGEVNDDFSLPVPFPGLSIAPVNSQGPSLRTPQGGKYCRITRLSEIALVPESRQPLARICGLWPWF